LGFIVEEVREPSISSPVIGAKGGYEEMRLAIFRIHLQ
jgi:hypothetical protein